MRLHGIAAAVLIICLLLLAGCTNLARNLPRIKIEPPPGATTASEQPQEPEPATSTDAQTASADVDSGPSDVETEVVTGTLPKATVGTTSKSVTYVPIGSRRTLTNADLRGLSKWQLDVLRNEIYAAHGRSFDRADLREYFSRKTWYTPDPSFSESRLSEREKRNAAFIAAYQKRGGQTTASKPTRTGTTRRPSGGGGQVLPFSSTRQVTSGDLAGLSNWELDVARNEIYARHGRPFKRADLRSHFRNQGWYSEDAGFSERRLSSLEKRNAEYIRNYQR